MIITRPETLADPDDPTSPTVRLIADASDTEGTASIENVRLVDGADGAVPHYHRLSHEVFHVLDGTFEVWEDGTIHRLERGDTAIIAPGTPHAFGAAAGCDADVLITITPGVERFEYFRQLARIVRGIAQPDSLTSRQEEFDTYFVDAPDWAAHRRR